MTADFPTLAAAATIEEIDRNFGLLLIKTEGDESSLFHVFDAAARRNGGTHLVEGLISTEVTAPPGHPRVGEKITVTVHLVRFRKEATQEAFDAYAALVVEDDSKEFLLTHDMAENWPPYLSEIVKGFIALEKSAEMETKYDHPSRSLH